MNKFAKTPADVIGELHPLFRPLVWVAAARSTDETRYILNHVLVERDGLKCNVIATDGRRLHVAEFDPGMFDDDIDMLEAGLYEVIAKSAKFIVVSLSDVDGTFPNWRKIFPESFPPHRSDSLTSKSISLLGIRTGVLLANDFVVEAIGFGHGFKKDATVLIDYAADPSGFGAFQIRHEIGRAVVMPLRIDGHETTTNNESPASDEERTPDLPEISEHLKSMQKTCAETNSTVTITTDSQEIEVSEKGIKARKTAKK